MARTLAEVLESLSAKRRAKIERRAILLLKGYGRTGRRVRLLRLQVKQPN